MTSAGPKNNCFSSVLSSCSRSKEVNRIILVRIVHACAVIFVSLVFQTNILTSNGIIAIVAIDISARFHTQTIVFRVQYASCSFSEYILHRVQTAVVIIIRLNEPNEIISRYSMQKRNENTDDTRLNKDKKYKCRAINQPRLTTGCTR